MTLVHALDTTTAGVRSAIVLLVVMAALTARGAPRSSDLLERYRRQTIALWLIAAGVFSPFHAARLLGCPIPEVVNRALDLAATSIGCAAVIHSIAVMALARAVPAKQVRKAAISYAVAVAAFVALAWTVR